MRPLNKITIRYSEYEYFIAFWCIIVLIFIFIAFHCRHSYCRYTKPLVLPTHRPNRSNGFVFFMNLSFSSLPVLSDWVVATPLRLAPTGPSIALRISIRVRPLTSTTGNRVAFYNEKQYGVTFRLGMNIFHVTVNKSCLADDDDSVVLFLRSECESSGFHCI